MIVSSAAAAPSTARSGHDCADNFTTTQSTTFEPDTKFQLSAIKHLLDLIIK